MANQEKRLELEETISRIKKVRDLYLKKAINIGGKDYHKKPQLSEEDRYNLEQISDFIEALECAVFYLENGGWLFSPQA